MTNNQNNKNLEIESLRGVAVILTMFSHLPMLLPFYSDVIAGFFFTKMTPWAGVDLFFCISGYVVSKAYLDKFDKCRQQGIYWLAAQGFFIRRAYRLFPSAWLWAVMGLLCSIFFNQSAVFATWFENVRSLATILTFTGNLANQYGLLLRPNDVYWSLALEEQFYFLFPIFLFFIVSARWRIGLLLTLIAIQFVINRNPFGTPLQGLLASFRLDAIMWGVLIYLLSQTKLYQHFEPVFLRNKTVSFIALSALLYLLVAIPAQLISMPIAVGLIAVITAILVFMASFNHGYIVKLPVIAPVLVWVGARSYGIYLIHVFSYRIIREVFTRYTTNMHIPLDAKFTVPILLSAFLLTIFLAEMNYRFIEVPLRNRGAKIAKEREQRIAESILADQR